MKSNAGGFTLVEIMIVVGVIAITLLALAGLSVELDKAPAYSEAKINLASVSNMVRETLKYKKTCEQALLLPNTGLSPAAILANTQEVKFSFPGINADSVPADDLLQAGSKVQKLNISKVKLVNTIPVGASGTKYFSEVQIEGSVSATGLALAPVIAGGFYYSLNAVGNQFASCDSQTVDPTPLCEEMGCTWNPLASPPCTCTPVDLTCPPQQFLTGVDTNSKPICTAWGKGAPCPAGKYLRGVTIGDNDCIPLPVLAPPVTPPSAADGVCGPADGGTYSTAALANAAGPLCSAGTSSVASLSGAGPWSWTCAGSSGGLNDTCSANQGVVPLCNGVPRPAPPSCGLMPYGGHKCEPSFWSCDPTGWNYNCWTYVISPAVCP